MKTIGRTLGAAAAAVVLAAQAGAQQQVYPQTLYWGSGLIDIPVAWVSPLSGDFAINYTGKRFEADPGAPKINYSNSINSQLNISMALFGRVELGYAAYSNNVEWGLFGRALLLSENDFAARGGAARWLPSVAVGVRNVGPYEHIDRFGVGYVLLPPTPGEPDAQHVADAVHQRFDTQNTLYGVVSKDISLADFRPNWPNVTFGLTAGYGNGLFKEDGGLGDQYAKHSTGGLFYGVKTDFAPTPNLTLGVMAENNAWDYNVGATAEYRGLRAGLYWTELGAGSADVQETVPGSAIYNYSKVAFALSWQSNIFALLKGDFLQNRIADLERRRNELLAQISLRQQRIAALELELNRYEAQNLLELEQRRAAAEAQLRAEREALRRLEERLRRVEQQQPPQQDKPPRK
ncbi:MAG TPA: hypothetical protein VNA89_09450 [Gemmatimonadaceae bacterium]|nr:hypothetical protein [Gemmatimonadaceae bacterium]